MSERDYRDWRTMDGHLEKKNTYLLQFTLFKNSKSIKFYAEVAYVLNISFGTTFFLT